MARRARSSKSREDKAKPKAKKQLEQAVDEAASVGTISVSEVKGAAKEKTGFAQWFRSNQGTLLILAGIFLLALLIRTYFYYELSFAQWPPRVVGNDPSYHLRVIEYVQSQGHHLTIDDLLNYPLSGGNPRPPIFD